MLRVTFVACVLFGALCVGPPHAAAQDAPATSDARACEAPSAAEAQRRAYALEAAIEPPVPAAARWWWLWLSGYLTAAVVQGVVAVAVEAPEWRWPSAVGAVSALLGAGAMLLSAVETQHLSDRVRAVQPLTGVPRLRAVERLLAHAAEGEDEARALFSHALGWGCALGEGLVLWLGFDQLFEGILSVAESVVVSEVQVATTPTSARELWRAHVALHRDAGACLRDEDESSALSPLPAPHLALVPAGLGVGLVLTF